MVKDEVIVLSFAKSYMYYIVYVINILCTYFSLLMSLLHTFIEQFEIDKVSRAFVI